MAKAEQEGIPRLAVLHRTGGRRLVKQSMAGDSDINVIMKKWHATGMLPVTQGRTPKYGDFSSGQSFTEALNAVRDAEEAFLKLPSAVRSACQNDPGVFLDMVADPEGRKELVELGLPSALVPGASAPGAGDATRTPTSTGSPAGSSQDGQSSHPPAQGGPKSP